MEALRETHLDHSNYSTVTLTIPQGSQMSLLRSLSRNMGWKMKVSKPKKAEHIPNATTIRAIMDVEAGKVFHAKSAADLIAQLNL